MKEGFKSSLLGFAFGVAVGILLILIAKWYAMNYFKEHLDGYLLALLGFLGSLIGIIYNHIKKIITKIFDDLNRKASVEFVLEQKKETSEIINMFHEQMTSMDHKLDILIKLNKE